MPSLQEPGLIGMIGRTYAQFAKTANYGQSIFLLIIRLYIGYECMISGHAHLTHFHDTVDNFKDWNIPLPTVNVAISGTTEIVGGALLFAGVASRIVGLVLTGNFIVAILAPSLANPRFHDSILHPWRNPDVILADTAFLFLATSIIVLLFGPGWFSVDGVLRMTQKKKSSPGFPLD